jgi:hypothetical protein
LLQFTRTRSSGGLTGGIQYSHSQQNLSCANLNQVHYSNNDYLLQGRLKVTTDTVTPSFRVRSRRGEIIITPYTTTTEEHGVSGEGYRLQHGVTCVATGAKLIDTYDGPVQFAVHLGGAKLPPISLITDAEINSAIGVAATQAWANSNGSDAQVLTDLGESRQTMDMFRRPASSLQPLLRAINRSRQARLLSGLGQGTVQTASALWLQYRYGVRPLVSSVNSICQALARPRVRMRNTYRGRYTLSRTASPLSTLTEGVVRSQVQEHQTDLVEIRTGILIEEVVEISTRLGIDASGMLSLPWELVPFSFVADWFINVGSFLQAISPSLTKRPLGTWYTVKRVRNRRMILYGSSVIPPSTSVLLRGNNGERYSFYTTKTRVPALPGPSLTFRPQALSNVFADLRGLDSFALALQNLGRIFRT